MSSDDKTTDATEAATARWDPRTGEKLPERQGVEFVEFVMTHRKGAMNLDVTEALDELVKAVTEIGKTGTLTLTITVSTIESDTDVILGIADEVKVRPPKRKGDPGLFYLQSPDGQIGRNAPQQSIYDHLPKDER